jgi:hypothetical protein
MHVLANSSINEPSSSPVISWCLWRQEQRLNRVATSTVALVVKRLGKDKILNPNGSTFRQWDCMICVLAWEIFYKANFLVTNSEKHTQFDNHSINQSAVQLLAWKNISSVDLSRFSKISGMLSGFLMLHVALLKNLVSISPLMK